MNHQMLKVYGNILIFNDCTKVIEYKCFVYYKYFLGLGNLVKSLFARGIIGKWTDGQTSYT